MRTFWKEEHRRELADRLTRIDPAQPAKWGRMNATQMVWHLTQWMRLANGELVCREKRTALAMPGIKHLVILVLPWPKGVPTAPEIIPRDTEGWAAERALLDAAIERLVARAPDESQPRHPIFGAMTRPLWGALGYRHTDHHLQQFGV